MSNEKILINCHFYCFKMDNEKFIKFKIDNTKVPIKDFCINFQKKIKRTKSSINNLNELEINSNNNYNYKKKKLKKNYNYSNNFNYNYYLNMLNKYLSFR